MRRINLSLNRKPNYFYRLFRGVDMFLFDIISVNIYPGSHLLEPRSRSELAFDIPVDGENAIGDEKPERGSAANRVEKVEYSDTIVKNSS